MNEKNYEQTIYNTPFITQRADPYIYRHLDGEYYFTASVPEYDRIILRHSDTLDGLKLADEVTIFGRLKYIILTTNGIFTMQVEMLIIYGI